MANLKQAAAKVAERIGLPGLVKQAKTSADYDAVLAELDGQIRTAREEFADLESKRSTFILDGGDVDAYQARVVSLRERLGLLEASREEAQRRQASAAASEARTALETRMAAVRAEHFDTYQRRLNDHALALRAAVESGKAIKRAEKAIEEANNEARHAGRVDLVMDPKRVRAEVKAALLDRSMLPPPPQRICPVGPEIARELRAFTTELSEVKKKQALMKKHGVSEQMLHATETDAAFNLREQNYQQLVADTIKREDPLKKLADEMFEIIDTVTTPRAPMDFRSNRRVNFQTFVAPDGQAYERRIPVDGIGPARPPQVAPLR